MLHWLSTSRKSSIIIIIIHETLVFRLNLHESSTQKYITPNCAFHVIHHQKRLGKMYIKSNQSRATHLQVFARRIKENKLQQQHQQRHTHPIYTN